MCSVIFAMAISTVFAAVGMAATAPIQERYMGPALTTSQPTAPIYNQPVSPGGDLPVQQPPSSDSTRPSVTVRVEQNPVQPVAPVYSYGSIPRVIRLKYLKADQAKALFVLLVPDERIKVEAANNSLVILSNDDEFKSIQDLVANVDVPPRQVMFEVEVIELNREDTKNIGIDWGAITALPAPELTPEGSAIRVDLRGIGMPKYGINIAGQINRLVDEKKGRILAKPRIAALDGQTAQILIGDRLAVQNRTIVSGSEVISVTYIDVGIKLEITPFINDDLTITAHLKPEVSNPTTYTNGNPNIRTRQAETSLRVKSGQTIILGGLLQREETREVLKVPFLGNLPIVGALFRSTNTTKRDTELVILLTPRIIEDK